MLLSRSLLHLPTFLIFEYLIWPIKPFVLLDIFGHIQTSNFMAEPVLTQGRSSLTNGLGLAFSVTAGLFLATNCPASAEPGAGNLMVVKNEPFKVDVAPASRPVPPPAPVAAAPAPAASAAPSLCPNSVLPVDQTMAMIKSEAQSQGLDDRLALAVAEQESGFGVNNNSDAGARGPMQLMPSAAIDYNVRDVCDYKQNIKGGVTYLKALWQEFDGNVFLIVAAYNAGKQNVYKARGVPNIGETVKYVSKIANSYYGYKNTLQRSRLNSPVVPVQQQAKGDSSADSGVLPVNTNLTKVQSAPNQWIGGTVLQVSQGISTASTQGAQ